MPLSTKTCKIEVVAVTRAMLPYRLGSSSLASTTETTKLITCAPQRSINRHIRLEITDCFLSIKKLFSGYFS